MDENGVKRLTNILLVPLFFVGLWTPLLENVGKVDPTPRPHERRNPASKPALALGWQALDAYPKAFEAYYNDHFGFRNSLISTYMNIQAALLGVSPVSWAVIGKEGWTFVAHDQALASYRCTIPLTEKHLRQHHYIIEKSRDIAAKYGAKYLNVWAPNKHSIYPEYLPDWLTKIGEESNLDQLLRYMAEHSDVEVLDLRPALLEAKKTGRLYFRANTHWNTVGGYVGYKAIAERIRPWFDNFVEIPEDRVRIHTRKRADYDPPLMIDIEKYRNVTIREARLREEYGRRIAKTLPGVALPQHADVTVFENPDKSLPRLVMFHDSFGYALFPFLKESFSRIVFSQRPYFSEDIIAHEKPDLVLEVHAERQLVPRDEP